MAGEIQIDSVTALTASGSNIVLNNVNTATNRTNLGLGSIATQAANSVSITGGNITGGTIGSGVVISGAKLASSGTSIYKSNGSTAVISESSGTATLNNVSLGSSVNFGSISNNSISGDKIHGGTISGSTLDSSVVFPAGGTGNAVSYALLYESYANNTNVNSSSGDQKRAINTEIYDADNLVSSISNGDFTLANAGTYLFEFYAEAYKTGGHQAYLKDVTNSNSVLAYGTVSYTGTSVSVSNPSMGLGYHTITTSNTYALWHYIKSGTTSGKGVNTNTGNLTCFSFVKITRLK